MRKAQTSDIPSAWIKSYNEVLGTNWNWSERVVYDNVQYLHGEGGTARTKAKNDMMSTVQGTYTYASLYRVDGWKKFSVSSNSGGMRFIRWQASYAAAYARHFKKQAIGNAVILGGHTAINCLMDL